MILSAEELVEVTARERPSALGSVPETERAQRLEAPEARPQLPDPESLERSTHQLSCDAIAAIRDTDDPAEVDSIWRTACAAFQAMNQPVPIDIEAARNERLEDPARLLRTDPARLTPPPPGAPE